MRFLSKQTICLFSALILSCGLLNQCDQVKNNYYQSLISFADEIKVIDTHEHHGWTEDYGDLHFRLPHLITESYLMQDIVCAGGQWIVMDRADSLNLEEYWEINGKSLDYCRGTSFYSHFVAGFQKLYDFDDLYFTESNIHDLSAQVEENYTNYRSWFDEAFHKAGFELMFMDRWREPFNTKMDEKYFALVFRIDILVLHSSLKPGKGDNIPEIFKRALDAGYELNTLDDYLDYCDKLFQMYLENNVVCVKNGMAYFRSLDYEDVPYEEARALFDKPSAELTKQEAKKIQDFVYHWLIQKTIKYQLPIQIHIGFLAGAGNWLENGKPMKLNNLAIEYPKARFVMLHGGFPWTGESISLGKMFSNVYLDLSWLPQISRQEAVQSLDEMFDAVPYNKIFWGGDCDFIEEATGSLEFGKSVVAEVLAARIKRGLLTEDVAKEMMLHIFRENAISVFNLEEKLGRTF
ncbi:MAG: amidohydrolase [Cytophagales bacterium]|nr:amidohydrolase [Cytophagales bacterium]